MNKLGHVRAIEIIVVEKLTEKQGIDVIRLQKLVFTDVSDEEAAEDFYNPKVVQVLAYDNNQLIGWAGVHKARTEFERRKVTLGGYGICTHPDWRRKGVASKVSQTAINYLLDDGCEVGFLSVDLSNEPSVRLHNKHGFAMLPKQFSWTNSKGDLKQSAGGMVAPLNSKELFEHILKGSETLYVGNGYW